MRSAGWIFEAIERSYPYPPDRVFRALTDPAALGDWLMSNDLQPKVGHKFQLRSKPQGNWNRRGRARP